jgi:hypothetical protein
MNASMINAQSLKSQQSETSYKFQRLREKLRNAVQSGELSGKLPGERALARRFHVNAKTLSKALTDLAAEGLLERSIGRGTFVKGSRPVHDPAAGRWLILCENGEEDNCTVRHLRELAADMQVATSVDQMRPSFINQFAAVVNLAASTPDRFLRELLVRNVPVVGVNCEPRAYSMHTVLTDVALGASRIGRDLLLAGHLRLGAIEARGSNAIAQALRHTAARYSPDAMVDVADPLDAAALVEGGVTALICASARDARQTQVNLARHGIAVPGQASLAAVGCMCPDLNCSGYFVQCKAIADAVVTLLQNDHPRPVSLWLAGAWIDRGTVAATTGRFGQEPAAPLLAGGSIV